MQAPFRVAVITGASSGLGAALALAYAGPNTALGLIGRNPQRLSDIAAGCEAAGARVSSAAIDVTDGPALGEWLREFDRAYPVELLVANAGISGGFASIAGGVLAAYYTFGIDAGHMIAQSVMSAPASLVAAKMFYPETQASVTAGDTKIAFEKASVNALDAVCIGAADGMKLVLNVVAMLLACLLLWGTASALWSVNPVRSLVVTARLAGLFAVGLVLAAGAALVAAPRRLTLLLLIGMALGIAMVAVELATAGALSSLFSNRAYRPTQLNQASISFALLVLPTSALLISLGHAAFAILLAAVTAATPI